MYGGVLVYQERMISTDHNIELGRIEIKLEFNLATSFAVQELGGWTTMHLACRYGHPTLVRDLMTQYGMDPNETSNVSNCTAAVIVWLARLLLLVHAS